MNAGDIVVICVVVACLAIIVLAILAERRERKKNGIVRAPQRDAFKRGLRP